MELMLPSAALNKPFVGADAFDKKVDDDTAKDSETGSYHAFRIGDIGLLIPQDTISEVAEALSYCQLPNTSAVLYGMANLRGNIIPIFDLHELFDFDTNAKSVRGKVERKVLIIGRGEDAVAVMISELPTRISISPEQRLSSLPPMPEALRPYIKRCYQEDGVWFDWDMDGFFDAIDTYVQ